jgi:hypothetical protein
MISTSSSWYLLYHSPPMAYLNKPGNNGPPVFPHIFADVYHLSDLMLNSLEVTHSVQAYTRKHHRQERELKAIRTLRSFGKVQIPVYRSVIWYSIVVRRPIWRILNPRRRLFLCRRTGVVSGEMDLVIIQDLLEFCRCRCGTHDRNLV